MGREQTSRHVRVGMHEVIRGRRSGNAAGRRSCLRSPLPRPRDKRTWLGAAKRAVGRPGLAVSQWTRKPPCSISRL